MTEASEVLSMFTEAKQGEAVMDGRGNIWRRNGDEWESKPQGMRIIARVATIDLACALVPDLAVEMRALWNETSTA